MGDELKEYVLSLINGIPHIIYIGAMTVLIVATATFCRIKGYKEGIRCSLMLLMVEYSILLYCSTVIFRKVMKNQLYDFMPLWSYSSYLKGDQPRIMAENMLEQRRLFV